MQLFQCQKPYDGQPATVGNGVMVALKADNPEQVAALYQKAMDLGASDEGKPGLRVKEVFMLPIFVISMAISLPCFV